MHPCDRGTNGGCDQQCDKDGDTAKCSCMPGYELLSDNKTCKSSKFSFNYAMLNESSFQNSSSRIDCENKSFHNYVQKTVESITFTRNYKVSEGFPENYYTGGVGKCELFPKINNHLFFHARDAN